MNDSRPNAVDGVVAGLVTGQVHDRPKPSSVDHWRTDAIAVPRTFEHRDVDPRWPAVRSRPGPRI